MNPRPLSRHLRNLCLLVAALGLIYLWMRFETYDLPESGCSPLLRFGPGDTLLLDRRPEDLAVGDALLFQGPDGLLYLAAVAAVGGEEGGVVAPGALWLETDSPECPGRDSDQFGWIAPEQVRARVVMVWPW